MKRLRLWTAILSIWLIIFFNIERILISANLNIIQTYTYIFVAGMLVTTLLLPKLRNLAFSILVITAILIFLVFWYNWPIWRKLPAPDTDQVIAVTLLTMVQVGSIILTGLLARQVTQAILEFEDVIADIAFNHFGIRPKPFANLQGIMYRELQRARYYQRPLSLIVFEVDEETIQVNLPRIVRDVQQAMMREYVSASIARVLDSELHDFNIIALRGNRFFVVLPEIGADYVAETAQRLGNVLLKKMAVKLSIGTASFPEEAATFETLIEQALANIRQPENFSCQAQISAAPAIENK